MTWNKPRWAQFQKDKAVSGLLDVQPKKLQVTLEAASDLTVIEMELDGGNEEDEQSWTKYLNTFKYQ